MRDRVEKTIEFRRADWLHPLDQTLEEVVRDTWTRLATPPFRTVQNRDGSEMRGMRSTDFHEHGFAIYCARYTDRQGVGTIQMDVNSEADPGERQPDDGENFLNSDLFALFRGNFVITMNARRNAATLQHYLAALFENAGLDTTHTMFLLTRVSDINKVAMIERLGVRDIELNTTISQAAAIGIQDMRREDSWWQEVRWALYRPIQAMIARDDSLGALAEAERAGLRLTIKMPKGETAAVKTAFDQYAADIVSDEDSDFTINLRNGQSLKPDEIAVRRTITVRRRANSVDADEVWREMENFMRELLENRVGE